MIPKIYISGNPNNRVEIGKLITEFKEIAEITHDWTIQEDENLIGNNVYLKSKTIVCADAIERSDYLIALLTHKDYITNSIIFTEIGIAIAQGVSVIICNTDGSIYNIQNWYIKHPLVCMVNSLAEIADILNN